MRSCILEIWRPKTLPFEFAIALRYVLAHRGRAFVSVMSSVSIMGVALGVMVLLISLAIVTGVQGVRRSRLMGASPHLTISGEGPLRPTELGELLSMLDASEAVDGSSPTIVAEVLLTSGRGSGLAKLKGIDPSRAARTSGFASTIIAGSFLEARREPEEHELPAIVLGEELAGMLGVGVSDVVTVVSPEGHATPLGWIPRRDKFRVAGIFRLGLYNYDSGSVLVDLSAARKILGLEDGAMSVEVKLTDPLLARSVGEAISARLGAGYAIANWVEQNRSLFFAFRLERIVTAIFVGFIMCVAALNILADQILTVIRKTHDIAVLRSMGAGTRSIMAIFILHGALVGLSGTLLGATIGVSLCQVLDRTRWIRLPVEAYEVTYVPFSLLVSDFIAVVTVAPMLCVLATVYPARRAANRSVSDSLRVR